MGKCLRGSVQQQTQNGLTPGYDPKTLLIDIIEKPQWQGWNADGTAFVKAAAETLTPDLINIYEEDGAYTFVIFDAKYYCIQLESGQPLRGQPGVGDVTTQSLSVGLPEFYQSEPYPRRKELFSDAN